MHIYTQSIKFRRPLIWSLPSSNVFTRDLDYKTRLTMLFILLKVRAIAPCSVEGGILLTPQDSRSSRAYYCFSMLGSRCFSPHWIILAPSLRTTFDSSSQVKNQQNIARIFSPNTPCIFKGGQWNSMECIFPVDQHTSTYPLRG